MAIERKGKQQTKSSLHPRNKHRERYDLARLGEVCPELKSFVKPNKFGDESIDFADPVAVKFLNRALLEVHYEITNWDIPEGYLCPPIPGRADYIHHVSELLCQSNFGVIPIGENVVAMDVGVGASCVYPIIGHYEYGWSFIGSDIDRKSIDSAQAILDQNEKVSSFVSLRYQKDKSDIFYGILNRDEKIDVSICNPPFHISADEARKGAVRKVKNLTGNKPLNPTLNFGGMSNELWCDGGERKFIRNIVHQSRKFADNCFWFTTLVSKQSNLKNIYDMLDQIGAREVKTIPMGQGNKVSRIVAWTFLSPKKRVDWGKERWGRK
ncbi:MAG: 23S rRNA (adenine(1618)-N(6))-methyltransferase RlmF [Crocinitomicaceae bacterium]|nr:23S rRNA (adenine(1618)-N(6))-methyltransferase RlmF [Crocinitomicaceae bacterium]